MSHAAASATPAEEIRVRPGKPKDIRRRPWTRRAYKAIVGALGVAVAAIARGLPLGAATALGRFAGRLAFRLSTPNRDLALENLAFVFPQKSERERRRLAEESFARLGAAGVVWAAFPHSEHVLDRFVSIEGRENLDAALAHGKGVLWITGHVGCWELMGARMQKAGYDCAVIATTVRYAAINRWTIEARNAWGVTTIERETAASGREILRHLRANGNLGILLDHDTKVPSVQVDFFGQPAWTAVGAAELAVKLGCAAVPAFIVSRAGGGYTVRIGAPILPPPRVPKPDQPRAIRDLTQVYTRAIEDQIRAFPEEWAWMHRRWKP